MNIIELKKYLMQADEITSSYLCPYLAFAKAIDFMNDDFIRNNPSNFSRMSMRKMMRYINIDLKTSNYVYRMIENGYTLQEIARKL